MRTTITLDDDVITTVKEEMRSGNGKTFKEAVNELIRCGAVVRKSQNGKRPRRKIPSFDMGTFENLNYDKPRELIDELEGTLHR